MPPRASPPAARRRRSCRTPRRRIRPRPSPASAPPPRSRPRRCRAARTRAATSPCKADSDCTSTKYGNAPAKDADCTCAAPCTPYVVNKTEAARREATNKKFCDTDDWYGPDCPAPDCSFIEFDRYRCKDGVCGGLALGKAQ